MNGRNCSKHAAKCFRRYRFVVEQLISDQCVTNICTRQSVCTRKIAYLRTFSLGHPQQKWKIKTFSNSNNKMVKELSFPCPLSKIKFRVSSISGKLIGEGLSFFNSKGLLLKHIV